MLHNLLGSHANPIKTGPVGAAAGGAVGPGQAAVLGGAVLFSLLVAPELSAGVAVGRVGAAEELLSKDLLALAVQAVRDARQLSGQRQGCLWGILQAVS